MGDRNNSKAGLVILVAVGLPMLGVLVFSHYIEADFLTTCGAVMRSIVATVVAGTFLYLTRSAFRATVLGTLALIWRFWWPVLDSIALGGIDPDREDGLLFVRDDRFFPWFDTPVFKYLVLATLVASAVYFAYKFYNDHH